MASEYKPHLLKLADYNDPILRKKTQPVKFPLSEEDKNIIADMVHSIHPAQLLAAGAPWESAVGMAANQWGIDKSIFLYCPSGDVVNDLQVIINPSYEALPTLAVIASQDYCDWEGCFSVPLATGNIKRNRKIKIKYQNELGETIERQIAGYPARVWQHENDHLNGSLYDDPHSGKCVEKKVFQTLDEVEAFYSEFREERRKK